MSQINDLISLYNLPIEIKFCKNCVMSNQRPRIVFDREGVCNACRNHELKTKTDWVERKKKLLKLLANYRKNNGDFDVVVPSSGGKDSSVVAHRLKYEFGMNPLTVTWSPNAYTKIGWENFTDKIIKILSKNKNNLVFILWGNYANKKSNLIDSGKHLILSAPHPSPFSAYKGFFGSRHFSKTNNYLKSTNQEAINWIIAS